MSRSTPFAALALLAFACGTAEDPDTSSDAGMDAAMDAGDPGTNDAGAMLDTEACSGWTLLEELYPDVTLDTLGACSSPEGLAIAETLMNFEGITVDGVVAADGSNVAAPCVQVLCDADFAYIASNALPHYTPQAAPIFETADTPIVHRIPLFPMANDTSLPADSFAGVNGCDSALNMAVVNETPEMPPFSHCWYETEDGSANTGEPMITDGERVYAKIHCYGQTAGLITGIPAFAPCEEARPDPYGSPLFWSYADPDTLFVDYCGTHPAAITHNHWVNEVCLAQDESGAPANGYATGATAFVIEDLDEANCSAESDIVGWAYDGHPMRGTCVCMERDASGACTDLRRARSGYVYAGLARWADDASELPNVAPATVEASYFGRELMECETSDDCCPGGDLCRLYCHPLLVEGEDSIELSNRCVSPDYSWCTHGFREHADALEETGYVYLDRCNGVETADGYSYVGTPTFPYVNSCYRDAPTSMATDDTFTRLDTGGMMGGGGGPPRP
ncbi:MAG: hypothetical protein AAF447_05860 [Myxococcota bacterium]